MEFRRRGGVVIWGRSNVNPGTKKRSKFVVIGRLTLARLEINDDLRKACTPAEVKEIEAWIAQHTRTNELRPEFAARTLADNAEMAIQWFERVQNEEARAIAKELLPMINQLRAALSKVSTPS